MSYWIVAQIAVDDMNQKQNLFSLDTIYNSGESDTCYLLLVEIIPMAAIIQLKWDVGATCWHSDSA